MGRPDPKEESGSRRTRTTWARVPLRDSARDNHQFDSRRPPRSLADCNSPPVRPACMNDTAGCGQDRSPSRSRSGRSRLEYPMYAHAGTARSNRRGTNRRCRTRSLTLVSRGAPRRGGQLPQCRAARGPHSQVRHRRPGGPRPDCTDPRGGAHECSQPERMPPRDECRQSRSDRRRSVRAPAPPRMEELAEHGARRAPAPSGRPERALVLDRPTPYEQQQRNRCLSPHSLGCHRIPMRSPLRLPGRPEACSRSLRLALLQPRSLPGS